MQWPHTRTHTQQQLNGCSLLPPYHLFSNNNESFAASNFSTWPTLLYMNAPLHNCSRTTKHCILYAHKHIPHAAYFLCHIHMKVYDLVSNIDLEYMHACDQYLLLNKTCCWLLTGRFEMEMLFRIQKASVRSTLNSPQSSSSHLDTLTCTLHNAWAVWIYITTHTHSHAHLHACAGQCGLCAQQAKDVINCSFTCKTGKIK